MKKFFYTFFAAINIFFMKSISAQEVPLLEIPKGSIDIFGTANEGKDGIVMTLELVQKILLTVVLPVVAVGTGIYVAYLLLTAEGDEGKMKLAWKSVVFSAIAMLVILFSAFIIRLIASLNIS